MKHEQLSPQQEIYEHGKKLAFKANEAFDETQAATTDLEVLQAARKIPGVEVAPEARDAVEDRLMDAHSRYQRYDNAVGALIGPEVFQEADEAQSPETPDAFSLMTPEQQETATKLRGEMAKRFEKFGVTEDTLRVVKTEAEDGEATFTLLHTGNGVDIGNPKKEYDPARSYDAVMSEENDKLFVFELDGKTYDSRKGMTDATYDAKFADAKERGVTLPDSKQLSEETGDVWTWTMLTGEPKTADGYVQLRNVYVGEVDRFIAGPDVDRRSLRVCPAVVIK